MARQGMGWIDGGVCEGEADFQRGRVSIFIIIICIEMVEM